ncbi:MAG: ASKHA domain-containing protein, partial [Phycisphaerae bacterium]
HPRAQVYGLPLVSHHVGADTAAVLATIPIEQHTAPFMVIDIGTNTEVAIGDRGRIICASCPAGPAFEGGRVSCGAPATDGAITGVRRLDGRWEVSSIGAGPLRGFCGSGLVDLLAELRGSGEMDELGRFRDGCAAVVLWPDSPLGLTRADASELAQAKAANAVGQYVLLRRFGVTVDQIGTYYLAGAFANGMNLDNARRIGLLLPVPDDRIVRIGNASIEGAKGALVSRACRDRIEALVRRVEHVELEQEPDFFDLFAEMTLVAPIPCEARSA